jgi:eukaryotic-like serine/threonine-protein kinase
MPIARQVAEALEAAHEQGIVHRDLKPANIKLRPDGTVKVLDFGLAKALEPAMSVCADADASPTVTSPALTRIGVLLGTAAYMSPEQAKGRPADKRSDVWAFGCVLYEMVSARRAFDGEDVSDTIAAVLRGEPDWTALPANLSPAIVALIRGCLDKDRRRRIGDLSTARFIIDIGDHAAAVVPPLPESRIRRAIPAVLAATTAAAIAAFATWTLMRVPAPSQPLARFTIPLRVGDRFSNPGVHVVALSPDNSHLVYTANLRLYLRTMDQLETRPIPGTEGAGQAAPRGPFFSADGQWIGFWAGGQIKKVPLTGGAPVVLCAAENPWGVSWAEDNTILYGQSEQGAGKDAAGIWRVSSDGGKSEHLLKVEADQIAQSPQLLPGGRAILFTLARRDDWDTAQIVVQSLDTGRRHVVLDRGADARYVPTGLLVYALGESRVAQEPFSRTLLAAPFDAATLAVTGGAVPIVDGVAGSNVTVQFAISSQRALVYVPSDVADRLLGQRTLAWVDRQGREDPIKAPPRAYLYPRLSPDGTRVALEARDQENDIWIWDLARETLTRLTFGRMFEQYGVWTHDGRDVIFSSSQVGGPNSPRSLFRRPSDGTGTAERLTESLVPQFPSTVTPDGTALIFRQQNQLKPGVPPDQDLLLLPLGGDRRPRPLVQTPFSELNAEVSADGRWLAYQSNETGKEEIYVRPFPNVEAGKWQVSTNGGMQPLWARNGRELFYVLAGALMRVPFTGASAFEAGKPSKVLDGPYLLNIPVGGGLGRMYDATRDGQRFLMIKDSSAADGGEARIVLVQNWFSELERRVPAK